MGVGGEILDGSGWRDCALSSAILYIIKSDKVMETIQSACVGNGHGMGVE